MILFLLISFEGGDICFFGIYKNFMERSKGKQGDGDMLLLSQAF